MPPQQLLCIGFVVKKQLLVDHICLFVRHKEMVSLHQSAVQTILNIRPRFASG